MVNSSEIKQGDKIAVCVPTGNFGNIFAAYIAREMGLPISHFICASNKNNILTDFIDTGVYDRNRDFYTTMSPSMDILISSNLERLLYTVAGTKKTAEYMARLARDGRYEVSDDVKEAIKRDFVGAFTGEEETAKTIAEAFADGYLCDTHTAVALNCAKKYAHENPDEKILVVSTASAYKFAGSVYNAIGGEKLDDEFDIIDALEKKTGVAVPAPLAALKNLDIRFNRTISASDMREAVKAFAEE